MAAAAGGRRPAGVGLSAVFGSLWVSRYSFRWSIAPSCAAICIASPRLLRFIFIFSPSPFYHSLVAA